MNKHPQMKHDMILGWIAIGHTSFIGWDILAVEEQFPGQVMVQVRLRSDPAHWIPASRRVTRFVLSDARFVPMVMWQARPFRFRGWDKRDLKK